MSTKQRSDDISTEVGSNHDPTIEELFDRGDQILKQMDRIVHDELSHKPEAVAEWEEIMREYADILAEDQREKEEKKLDSEIREWMDRIKADVDRLTKLDPADLELNETLSRTFASLHDVDAVMRLRCRHYPDKLAKWEDEVMGPIKHMEAVVADAIEAEEAKPGN